MKSTDDDINDWRLAFSAIVSIDNPQFGVKKGTRITTVSNYSTDSGKLAFNIPSGTALFLEFASDQYGISMSLRQKALMEVSQRHIKNDNLFPYFESISASFIFSFVALEAFANECIPKEFYHEKKYKEIWTAIGKENIERGISTEIKIGDVLPKIFGIPTIKGTKIWKKYLEMKEIRDRLVHLKSKERHSISPTHDTIWDQLLNAKFESPIKTTIGIITHYVGNEKVRQPWWFQSAPEKIKGQ